MTLLKMQVNDSELYTGDGKHFSETCNITTGFSNEIEAAKAKNRLEKAFKVVSGIRDFTEPDIIHK